MADGHASYPSVFVVDSGAKFPPPLPPKPGHTRILTQRTRRNHIIQNTLMVLVCVALCGLLVEGYFLYTLHRGTKTSETIADNAKTEQLKGDQDDMKIVTKKPKPPAFRQPSRPLVHLIAGHKKPIGAGIMEWSEHGNNILYKVDYRNGKLIVQKEGYYYVYSMLTYSADSRSFIQTIERITTLYMGGSLTLLKHSRYDLNPSRKDTARSSYLGGVFHLYKDDAVFVRVNNGSLIRLSNGESNYFGMFML